MSSGNSKRTTDNPPPPAIEPRWLKPALAGQRVCRSVSWLKKARQGKTNIPGPPFRKIGRSIFYPLDELDSWQDQFGPSMTVLPGKNEQKQADA